MMVMFNRIQLHDYFNYHDYITIHQYIMFFWEDVYSRKYVGMCTPENGSNQTILMASDISNDCRKSVRSRCWI